MQNNLIQPKGSVSREMNKESIARIFGIEKSSVGYLSTSVLIDSYNILYDESTETCWYRGTATGTTISWGVSGDTLTLITTTGTFGLKKTPSISDLSTDVGASLVQYKKTISWYSKKRHRCNVIRLGYS